MTKHILLFAATFLLGALIALAARTALHDPHAATTAPAPANHTAHEHHTAPTAKTEPKTQNPERPTTTTSTAATAAPVNSVCAICGMKVDPSVPTLEYKGQRIGFGCRMCPPKFKANPDKYGPYYLRNEVMPK